MLHVPALGVGVANNQYPGLLMLAQLGAIKYLGPVETVSLADMTEVLHDLLHSPQQLQDMALACRETVSQWIGQRSGFDDIHAWLTHHRI